MTRKTQAITLTMLATGAMLLSGCRRPPEPDEQKEDQGQSAARGGSAYPYGAGRSWTGGKVAGSRAPGPSAAPAPGVARGGFGASAHGSAGA